MTTEAWAVRKPLTDLEFQALIVLAQAEVADYNGHVQQFGARPWDIRGPDCYVSLLGMEFARRTKEEEA